MSDTASQAQYPIAQSHLNKPSIDVLTGEPGLWPPDYEPWKQTGESPAHWLGRSFEHYLFPESYIIRHADRYSFDTMPDQGSGVYFLVSGGRIVYVGQSRRVSIRLQDHWHDYAKPFSHFWALYDVPKLWLDAVENFYIHAFEPPLNNRYWGFDPIPAEYLAQVRTHERCRDELD